MLELLRQRGNACSVPPEHPDLHTSTLHLDVHTPAAHFHSSEPLCLLHVRTRAARLQSSRAPDLQYINVHTPATHLQSSNTPVRPPRPYTYSTPPELPISSISTSTRLQRISRAPMPLCLLHGRTRAARLQSSRSPFLYISTSTRL